MSSPRGSICTPACTASCKSACAVAHVQAEAPLQPPHKLGRERTRARASVGHIASHPDVPQARVAHQV
eukprot:4656687-Prymnesium_polylepis.1